MLSLTLKHDGFEVEVAPSADAALHRLGDPTAEFAICLTDIRMPKMSGLDLIRAARAQGIGATRFVAMSAYGDEQVALEALRLGSADYISKPFDPDALCLKLRLLLAQHRRMHASAAKAETPLIFEAPAMRDALDAIDRAAPFPSTVLLTGATGTGKERMARRLHAQSPRRDAPFVPVNCAAIPETLLESVLFGHRKGAFTDAHEDRVGLYASADGGTLFLDEIAELSVALQVKLLRALESGEVHPLGAATPQTVDVRLVAATSRPLEQWVEEGRFREDLYFRLSVIPIRLPALRDRPDDILPLARAILSRLAERFALSCAPAIDPAAEALLQRYRWPGNVRELENVLERAIVMGEAAGHIRAADLPALASAPDAPSDAETDLNLRRQTAKLEAELIDRALEETGGNRAAAAERLGLSVRALQYRLSERRASPIAAPAPTPDPY